MLKSVLGASVLTTLVSTVFAAGPLLGKPPVWECDAPGTEGYFISEQEVHFEHAAAACASSGGVLADITNQNFLFATDMILNCVGENENAWIRSWDYNPTNPQTRDCLAIYVGFAGPGGGIDLECGESRYALCQEPGRRHTGVGSVRNYGAYNATQTVTVTKTLMPQNNGAYTIPYTMGTATPVTYYGTFSDAPSGAVSTEEGTPIMYTIQTVLAEGDTGYSQEFSAQPAVPSYASYASSGPAVVSSYPDVSSYAPVSSGVVASSSPVASASAL